MEDELGTDPELLWRLLLVQIVYDQLVTGADPISFDAVVETYKQHPLLPQNAPVIANGGDAEAIYTDLLREYEIDSSKTPLEQCQLLAEPIYVAFHKNLLDQMENDVNEFEKAYLELEEVEDFPKDERLGAIDNEKA